MENPWADPWTQKPAEEADLANPSWSTGADIRWDEPSDFPSLWNNNNTDAAPAWVPPESPYDDLPIASTLSQSDIDPSASPVSESQGTIGFHTAPASPKQHSPPTSLPPSPALYLRDPTPLTSTRSASPDGYGAFESANIDIGVASWTVSASSPPSEETAGDNAWGAVWAPIPDPESPDEGLRPDEWEVAKLQKEKQDQHVPPELLASIIQQVKELSNDLWPESPPDQREMRQPSKDLMTDVPSLASSVEIFVPENLVLPPNVQLAKTFTLKHMNEALRLTKNLPMSLSSPLAIYLASKGSTAWEASVKSKHDIHQDDVLAPGWRMVEKAKREASPLHEVKKKPGGLLSFFGLKTSENSPEPTSHNLSPSSSRPASIIGNAKSPSSSFDGGSKPASEHQSSVTTMAPPAPTSSASTTSHISGPKAAQEIASQPSAVSRLFGRFSRSSAASPQASGSQSLALSSDDIEFLSDIVPSANDGPDADDDMKSLTTPGLLATKPPRVSSLPKPLPPPSKPSSLPPPLPGASIGSSTKHAEADDPFSFFDDEQPLTSKESKSIRSLVPLGSVRETLSAPNSSTLPTTSFRPSSRPTTLHTASNSRTVAPANQRRNVTAIMLDSGHPTGSNLQAPLPPAPLPPPPSSPGTLTSLVSLQSQQSTSLFDDDDFSDFMSSPATTVFVSQPSTLPTIPANLSNTATPSTVSNRVDTSFSMTSLSGALSNQSLFHSSSSDLDGFANSTGSKSGSGLLGDFSDFISSPISAQPTPPPPRPPSKPPTFSVPRPPSQPFSSLSMGLPVNQDPLQQPPPPAKHGHSRTVNLMESGAARPGRWPTIASPSPHPVIPPPPLSAGKVDLNLFDDLAPPPKPLQASTAAINNPLQKNVTVQAVNKPNLMSPLRTMTPPLIPTQVNANRTNSPTPWSFGANGSKPSLTPLTPSTTAGNSGSQKTGGLSVQDLSFFEGL